MHSVAGRRRLETEGLSRVPLEHGKLKQVRPLRARLLRAAVWSGTIIAAKIAENSKNTQGMAKKGFINVKQGFVTSCRNKDSGTCTHVLVAFLCVFMYINQSFFPCFPLCIDCGQLVGQTVGHILSGVSLTEQGG